MISSHTLAEIDEDLIGGINANQATPRAFKVGDHIHSQRQDRHESHYVEPASIPVGRFATFHQQRPNENQSAEQQKYDGRWMTLGGGCAVVVMSMIAFNAGSRSMVAFGVRRVPCSR